MDNFQIYNSSQVFFSELQTFVYSTAYSSYLFGYIIGVSYFTSHFQTYFSYSFSNLHSICLNLKPLRQIVLSLSLKHIQNFTIYHYLHCYHSGSSYLSCLDYCNSILTGLSVSILVFVLLLNIAATVIVLK